MTCQDFLDDIDLSALRTLEVSEDARLRAHAAGCESCRTRLLAAEEMVSRLALAAPVVRAPRALRTAVMDAVRSTDHPPAFAPVPLTRRPAKAVRRLPAQLSGLAAAVLLVPLAGSLLWNARLQRQVDDLKRLEQQIAGLQREAAEIQRQNDGLVLFSVPSAIKAEFRPVSEDVSARGAATWSPERNKCYVRFDQLPRPSHGETYRLWYVVDGNRVVDAGILNPDDSGRADTTIDTSRWRGKTYEMLLRMEHRPNDAEAEAILTAILTKPQ